MKVWKDFSSYSIPFSPFHSLSACWPISYQCSHFISPEKNQKTCGFLRLSGGIKWEHWPETGYRRFPRIFQRLFNKYTPVCNFQSMKNPVELNSLFSKFFCYVTWLDATQDDLQTSTLCQILLFLRNNSLAV